MNTLNFTVRLTIVALKNFLEGYLVGRDEVLVKFRHGAERDEALEILWP